MYIHIRILQADFLSIWSWHTSLASRMALTSSSAHTCLINSFHQFFFIRPHASKLFVTTSDVFDIKVPNVLLLYKAQPLAFLAYSSQRNVPYEWVVVLINVTISSKLLTYEIKTFSTLRVCIYMWLLHLLTIPLCDRCTYYRICQSPNSPNQPPMAQRLGLLTQPPFPPDRTRRLDTTSTEY